MRAPTQLWGALDKETQEMVIAALSKTRSIKPFQNNWLLFSGMIESFFLWAGAPWDAMRLDYSLVKHEDWYKGDGVYGDGPVSIGIIIIVLSYNLMLVDIHEVLMSKKRCSVKTYDKIMNRAVRYAQIQSVLLLRMGLFRR